MARSSSFRWAELTDWIFPRLEGSEQQVQESETAKATIEAKNVDAAVQRLPSDIAGLKAYLSEAEKLLEKEQSRRQSVEARLTSIVGLMSIAATVVLSGILAMATGTMPMQTLVIKCVLVLGSLYLTLQLYIALSQAVKGLSRQAGFVETGLDLFPRERGEELHFLRSRIRQKLSHLADSRMSTNAKVGRMALAQVALRNFLAGLLFLAFAAALIAFDRDPPKPAGPCQSGASTLCVEGGKARESETTSSPSVDGTSFRASDFAWPGLMVMTGIPLVLLGVFLVVAGPPLRRTGVGLALVASGLSLGILGGSKIELVAGKFESLIGKLDVSLFARKSTPQSQLILTRLATVGPFPDGHHLLSSGGPVIECLRTGIKLFPRSAIVGWQIVGRVDKRGLRPDRAAVYGSNQALAMARAVWVRDHLLAEQEGFDPANSIVSVGGARNVGDVVDDVDLRADRVVDIHIWLQRAEPQLGTSPPLLPKGVVCPQ